MKIREITEPVLRENTFRDVQHDENYLYHATSEDRLNDIIAARKMKTYRPWHGTEQDVWPDGSDEPRNYWGPNPGHVEPFIPDFPPTLVRARREHVNARPERGTGDFYGRKPVAVSHLERWTDQGWQPLVVRKKPTKRQAVP